MKRLAGAAFVSFLLMAGSATAQAPTQPVAAPQAERSLEEVLESIDRRFETYQREHPAPGLVWGLVMNGRLVHVRGFGAQEPNSARPITADSLFRIASMSKAFTALAILKLRDDGRLRLDDLAEVHVPEMRNWRYPTADSPRIRVRDLLSHVGGFVTDNPWGDRQQPLAEAEFTRMLAGGVPFSRTAGMAYEYSNFGYALLGRIIANVSGQPYDRYIREQIMVPLGMASTGYDVLASPQERRAIGYRWQDDAWQREPDMAHGAFGAMGGVETSATDYARWVAFLLSAWPPRDEPERGPVARASVRELAQGLNFPRPTQRSSQSRDECPMAAAYGMGFGVTVDCDLGMVLQHSGGYPGYGSYLMLVPGYDVGIFAFTNGTYAAPVPAVWDAMLELHGAGRINRRELPVSEALATGYRTVGALYRAGNVDAARDRLAMNFLMDRSAEDWSRHLLALRQSMGECRTGAPIAATGALSGQFTWHCEKGAMQGQLLLAPTNPPGIQELHLEPASTQ